MTNTQQPTIPAEDGEIRLHRGKWLIDGKGHFRGSISTVSTKYRTFAKRCKHGHLVAGNNLFLKKRRRWVNGNLYEWYEKCCVECYDQWRANYREKAKESPHLSSQLTQYNQSERSVEDE